MRENIGNMTDVFPRNCIKMQGWFASGGFRLLGVVGEVRAEPALHCPGVAAPAPGVVGDLVPAETADREVLRLRVREDQAADRRRRRREPS